MSFGKKYWIPFLAVLMLLFCFVPVILAAQPGSAGDPLVTRSWADDYINQRYNALSAQITAMEQDVAELKESLNLSIREIRLWIGSQTVWINGTEKTVDAAPVLLSNITFVPMRFISDALGAEMSWDNQLKQATYTYKDKEVVVTVGSTTALVNGAEVSLLASPFLQNNRTLVPLRFVSET